MNNFIVKFWTLFCRACKSNCSNWKEASAWQKFLRNEILLKVIYVKCFLFYAIISYQFKTSEPKNVEKFVEAKSSRLKVVSEWTGNVHFCTMCDITFPVGGCWKVLKNGFSFCMNPVIILSSASIHVKL